MVSQDGGDHGGFYLEYSGADHRLAFSFAGTRVPTPAAPGANRWYHLGGVRDAASGAMKLHVGGRPVGTRNVCLGDASAGHTVIGRGQYGGSPVDFANGAIDRSTSTTGPCPTRKWPRSAPAEGDQRRDSSGRSPSACLPIRGHRVCAPDDQLRLVADGAPGGRGDAGPATRSRSGPLTH
ncbi:MAG TPA: LamG-like jellyroll fold domain-containing protein [Amycolatopsis sp.]|uniref:LamG-like jellyroll fold domain-containing protein n=1 Tax=Amycolatopsis sp. TaxID=37632 RepID=UPI002B48CB50|nr:LamG-like jellyroll fold domain-containing protein [Amycolatopsis sp.]HKS44883.1 LamG-like jellyroll fold domain-containing protein [Amycolatopsis sp.]